jgi:integrase
MKKKKTLKTALDQREEQILRARASGTEWKRKRGFSETHRPQGFADHIKPTVLVSLNTGMRRGEFFNLRWSDLDFSSNQITIEGAGTKSGQTRYIPINSELVSKLKSWR